MVNFFVSHKYGPHNVHPELSEPDETHKRESESRKLRILRVPIACIMHHLIALVTCGPIPIRCCHFKTDNCDHRGFRALLMAPMPLATVSTCSNIVCMRMTLVFLAYN